MERTIARFGMFDYDSRIAVAVSGGKDSLNLLHILCEIEEKFPRAELIAISIDEGIDGYRDEALKYATEACRSLRVEYRILSFKEIFGLSLDEIAERREQEGLKTCTYCGVLRRRALNMAAKEVEADRLATAHNLDDTAQTALLNLLRGDLRRMRMMHPAGFTLEGFVRRVKPFCEVPERESTLHAHLKGFGFQTQPCPYAEEAMRTDIRRFLNYMETRRPGTKFIVYRTTLRIIKSLSGLEKRGQICRLCGEPTTEDVCRVCQLLRELEKR